MNRKPMQLLMAAASVAALALAGCAAQAAPEVSGDAAGPDGLNTPGVLNHCVSLSYPPLEFYENGSDGEIVGWDVRGAQAVAESWGVEYQITTMAFDGLIPGVDTGACDLIWSGMYVNDERQQVADAVPVLRTGSQIVVREDVADEITEVTDLCGRGFAAQVATEDLEHLQEASAGCEAAGLEPIAIQQYPGTLDALATIRGGRLDGLIDTTVLGAELERLNDDMVSIDGLFALDYWFGAYTKKDSPLGVAFRDTVAELSADGTLQALAEEYALNPDHVVTPELVAELSTRQD